MKTAEVLNFIASFPKLAFRKFRRGIWRLSNAKTVDLEFEGKPYPDSVKRIAGYSRALTIESYGVLEKRPVSHAFQRRDLFELSDVNVDLRMGEVYLHSGEFVIQSTPWHPYSPNPERRWLRPTVSLNDPGGYIRLPSWTYYHQVIENLPHYLYLKEMFPQARTLVSKNGSEISRLILEELGIPYKAYEGQVKVNKLYLVGQGRDSGYPHPVDIKVLIDYFESRKTGLSDTKVIYVSRLMSSRSFVNEKQLVELLRVTPGVTVLESESLSFFEQITLFSNAAAIIGPHGAGLTNQIWMKRGGKVVELVDRSYSNPVFENLAFQLGHRHKVVYLSNDNGQSFVDIDEILKEAR